MKKSKAPSATTTKKKSWTVAVFMVGDPDLRPAMSRDLVELESVGSSDQVNVVVAQQLTARSGTNFFELPLGSEGTPARRKKVGQSTDGALEDRLDEFLRFLLKDYPADHYLLVMWGHAGGFGFGQLAPRSGDDLVQLHELADVLRAFRDKRGKNLEILGFCACALSKAEFALELRDALDFLVSSQIGISTAMTWPFDSIVGRVVLSPKMTPQSLAAQIVRCFEESYEPPPIALTALDLQQSQHVKKHVNDVAEAILAVLAEFKRDALSLSDQQGLADAEQIERVIQALPPDQRQAFTFSLCVLSAFHKALDAFPYEHEELMDFFDFCRKLVEQTDLRDSGEKIRDRARDVLDRGAQAFVAQNARAGPKLAALNGLSIIAPDFKDENWEATWSANHGKSAKAWLWSETSWPRMTIEVHRFAMSIPPEFRE